MVLVHAQGEEAGSFYRHYESVESPLDAMAMMMLVDDGLSQASRSPPLVWIQKGR